MLRSKRWSGGGRETDEGHKNQQNDGCIKQYLFPIEAVATRVRHNEKTTTCRRVKEREKEKEGGGAKETDGTQRENDDSETSDRKRKRRGGRKKWTDENRKGKKVQGMRKRTRAGNGTKN